MRKKRQVKTQVIPAGPEPWGKEVQGTVGKGRGNWPVQKVKGRFLREETFELWTKITRVTKYQSGRVFLAEWTACAKAWRWERAEYLRETTWMDTSGEESAYGDRAGKKARSSPGEPCRLDFYLRRWENQRIFSSWLTSSVYILKRENGKKKDKKEKKEEKQQLMEKDWLITNSDWRPDSVLDTGSPVWIGQKLPRPHNPVKRCWQRAQNL